MDASELLDLYRAQYDVVRGEQALTEYWFQHYHYPVDSQGLPLGYWVARDDRDHSWRIESIPDFHSGLVFMVPHGEGEPAAYCYRCPTLLTLSEILIDSPQAGLHRPVCQECRDATH